MKTNQTSDSRSCLSSRSHTYRVHGGGAISLVFGKDVNEPRSWEAQNPHNQRLLLLLLHVETSTKDRTLPPAGATSCEVRKTGLQSNADRPRCCRRCGILIGYPFIRTRNGRRSETSILLAPWLCKFCRCGTTRHYRYAVRDEPQLHGAESCGL